MLADATFSVSESSRLCPSIRCLSDRKAVMKNCREKKSQDVAKNSRKAGSCQEVQEIGQVFQDLLRSCQNFSVIVTNYEMSNAGIPIVLTKWSP